MQPLDSSSLYLPEELAAKIAKALAPDLRPAGATEGFNPSYGQSSMSGKP